MTAASQTGRFGHRLPLPSSGSCELRPPPSQHEGRASVQMPSPGSSNGNRASLHPIQAPEARVFSNDASPATTRRSPKSGLCLLTRVHRRREQLRPPSPRTVNPQIVAETAITVARNQTPDGKKRDPNDCGVGAVPRHCPRGRQENDGRARWTRTQTLCATAI